MADIISILSEAHDRVSQGRNYGKENPFIGTPYEEMWNNNPYATQYYDSTFWDNIGLSNKAKDANAEYERLYNEYIAGIYDQQRQDQYNSPAEEVERMRQAGLNPDLQGLSGNGTDAMSAPNAGPNPSLNGQSPAVSSLNMIGQILGFATSAMQSIATIKNLSSITTGNNINNLEGFYKIAEPHIVNEYSRRFLGNEEQNWSDIMNTSAMQVGKHDRDLYKKAFSSLLSSSKFTSSEKAYQNINKNDKALHDFINKMAEYESLSRKHHYQASSSKSLFDMQFYDSLDPNIASSATNRENSNRGWLEKWRNGFYKLMYEDFKDGSDLAGLILIGASGSFNVGSRFLTNTARGLDKIFGN